MANETHVIDQFKAQADDITYHHVNVFSIDGNKGDAYITFGERVPGGKLIPRPGIAMSLPFLKLLHGLLGTIIEQADKPAVCAPVRKLDS